MITVLGSINLDFVVHVQHHPVPGETILGGDVETQPGGKGANQAVAAARAGARVRMVGCLGGDGAGAFMRDNLEREGIDTTLVKSAAGSSGAAFIAIDSAGQNSIIVSPGVNALVRADELTSAKLACSKLLLMQLEIPLETVLHAANLARRGGVKVVLNAAPAQALSAAQLHDIDVLVVNELEAGTLAGRTPTTPSEALEVARGLRTMVETVIVTMGAQGAVCSSPTFEGRVSTPKVNVVDTTAAGDAFIGALSAALSEGVSLDLALRRGAAAGALACTKAGAQPSLPTRDEIEALVGSTRWA
jgi:ribokinase